MRKQRGGIQWLLFILFIFSMDFKMTVTDFFVCVCVHFGSLPHHQINTGLESEPLNLRPTKNLWQQTAQMSNRVLSDDRMNAHSKFHQGCLSYS